VVRLARVALACLSLPPVHPPVANLIDHGQLSTPSSTNMLLPCYIPPHTHTRQPARA